MVRDRIDAADGVIILTFGRADKAPLPEWEPGAHIDIIGSDGECRQYSLCGRTDDPGEFRVAILEETDGRGFSRRLHRGAQIGSEWTIRGPRLNFELKPADSYIFIAGGIGITPLIPMIAKAESDGAEWKLLYGGRSLSSMAFLDELESYGDHVIVASQDEVGLLPLSEWLGESQPSTAVYCCGPEPLIQAVERACETWPRGSLHTERFAPKKLDAPVLSKPFEVVLEQSKMTLQVPPDKSILEVIGEAGIPTLSACQEGTCGTCETAVLEGIPDHRDSVLDEEEQAANDYMMICISRSCTRRLVLDM